MSYYDNGQRKNENDKAQKIPSSFDFIKKT